ncbi:urea transporter [Thalassotalea sp. ND16A]|uniref:urea transporter n=1 Tax=Thalassotalea sp. ND16A TaxID=1535422 RepID=UPI00051A00E2|nr:urea transporter [Thalassotalea sp. ND16A]KGJ89449.1 hypothetical protein ND16A_2342 [Thalassotalea sp. ND16A]
MNIPYNQVTKSFLHSFGQIMLQGNMLTGLLFLIGIGLNSPLMLLGASIATLAGLVCAKLLQYDLDSFQNGLYGFNAALVGIAVFFFLPPSVFSLALVISGGVLATVVMHFMQLKLSVFSAYTAPFVISTWLILTVVNIAGIDRLTVPLATTTIGDFYSVLRGVGQVMFQDYWLSGVVFIAGILLHSFKAATWAVIGSGLGMLTARIFSFSEDLLLVGSYGFNACLVAIALSAHFEQKRWPVLYGIVLSGIVLSVLLTRFFEFMPLPALTAPFVLSSWLVILLVRINHKYATHYQRKIKSTFSN